MKTVGQNEVVVMCQTDKAGCMTVCVFDTFEKAVDQIKFEIDMLDKEWLDKYEKELEEQEYIDVDGNTFRLDVCEVN